MVLDESLCLELLRSTETGRVGLSVSALPVVVPVRFVVTERRLLLYPVATAADDDPFAGGAALMQEGTVACLQADGGGASGGPEGWTVLATGRLGSVTAAEREFALRSLGAAGGSDCAGLSIELLSGRRTMVGPEARTA
jgi:nitroimidazol reductase NimA-like FMN-containing flavoprotein (pyridoxamine 5'-phosphate oxidase superfamily)